MSARKKRQKTQGTGKRSERRTSQGKQLNQGKSHTEQLPDLDAVYYEVFDAYSIIRCAVRTIDESNGEEDETAGFSSLHQGVEALGKAVGHLEDAAAQLFRFQRAGGAS